MSTQTHDLRMARDYLNALDPNATEFTFQTFGDRKSADQKFDPLAKVFHGRFDDIAPKLVELNEQGAGVFVMLNEGDGVVHDGYKTCRTNTNVVRVRAAYLDLDGAPVEPVNNAEALPHILVESSPGRYHAIWRVSGCALEEFSQRQVALAHKFDGDPSVKDLARVVRLPGFYHQKGEPFLTKLLYPVPTSTQQTGH
jgi:hypothetical protein